MYAANNLMFRQPDYRVLELDLNQFESPQNVWTLNIFFFSHTPTGEGHTALSVSAYYGWIDIVKYLVDTVGQNPNGILKFKYHPTLVFEL